MRTSLRSTSSMLWSDALRTVTPPTCTGSSSATGVSTPVRPTDGKMFTIRVVAWRGLNLKATAQRGEREISRSEEHTSELQSRFDLVCRLLPEKKKIHKH